MKNVLLGLLLFFSTNVPAKINNETFYWKNNVGDIFETASAACDAAIVHYENLDGSDIASITGRFNTLIYPSKADRYPYYTCGGTAIFNNPDRPPFTDKTFGSANRFGSECPEGTTLNPTTGLCSNDQDKGGSCGAGPIMQGNPINAAVGNKYQKETDYISQSNSLLGFTRHYNNMESMEQYWTHTFSLRLRILPHTIALVRADGRESFFDVTKDIATPLEGEFGSLTKTGTGWHYLGTDGKAYDFDSTGRITAISTAKGTITVTYNRDTLTATDHLGKKLSLTLDSRKTQPLQLTIGDWQLSYSYDEEFRLTALHYPDGSSRRYYYNEQEHTQNTNLPYALTGIAFKDAQGVETRYATYRYNSKGHAYATSHTDGTNLHTLSFTPTGKRTEVTDALGTTRVLEFTEVNGAYRLTSQSKPAAAGCSASSSSLVYDQNGNVASRTKFDGVEIAYTYDLNRNLEIQRVEAATSGEARTITTVWHPDWSLTTKRAVPKGITHWVYHGQPDPFGGGTASCAPVDAIAPNGLPFPLLCKQVEQETTDSRGAAGFGAETTGASRITTYSYNKTGQVLTVDGPRTDTNDIWQFEYWPDTATCLGGKSATSLEAGCRGELHRIINPLGQVTEFPLYNVHGQPLKIISVNGVVSKFNYDNRLRLVSQTTDEATTAYSYDHRNLITAVTLPSGQIIEYQYDDAKRLIGIEQPQIGTKLVYTLDPAGNRIEESLYDQDGKLATELKREYDTLGRLWKVISAVNGSNAPFVFEHDTEDRLIVDRDPQGNSRHSNYNSLGQLIETVDRASNSTTYAPSADDTIAQVQAANRATTSYQSNGFGQTIEEISPDRGTTKYGYDEAGNLKVRTDAKGIVTNYSYDALNRLTSIIYPGNTSENASFSYDNSQNDNKGVGLLTSYSNDSGSTTIQYDKLGRVTQQNDTIADWSFNTRYNHDAMSRVTRITYPSGRIVNYTRDIMGRINKITTQNDAEAELQTLVSEIQYRPFGGIESMQYGNGIIQNYSYDLDGRLQSIIATGIGNIRSEFYSYDLNGNVSGITDNLHANKDRTFLYDKLSHLSDERYSEGEREYQYDEVGNRTRKLWTKSDESVTTTSNEYVPDSNRITQANGKTWHIDAAGNTIKVDDGQQLFTYNHANRLKTYTEDGILKGTYYYNALGQRVRTNKVAEHLLHYDQQGRYLSETNVNSNGIGYSNQIDYIYLDDQPIAQVQTNYNAQGQAENRQLLYLHTDHLNTPRMATDAVQKIIWRWDSDAFGQVAPNEDPDNDKVRVVVNLRFPGQIKGIEAPYYYNYYRDYDPDTGRYLESDPIGLEGGLNTYAYVQNNPLMLIDPDGLKPCPPGMAPPGVPCHLDDGDGTGSGHPNEGRCATAECAAGIPPNPNYSDEAACKIKCNTLVGLICGPVAGATTETGPGAVGVFLACRAAVYGGCAKACEEDKECKKE